MVTMIAMAIGASAQSAPVVDIKSVSVEKVRCYDPYDKLDGYRLVISVHRQDTILRTPANVYNLDMLKDLPDSFRLILIDKLLQFKGDTSRCCKKIGMFYYDGIERTCYGKPKSSYFSIQIDALFMINKIVYPFGTSLYSCRPVVVNPRTKKELNERHGEIIKYYKVYERSYRAAREKGRLDETFRFNTRRYAWFGAAFMHD
ncbi:hypothetical protein [Chitinophaga caseinilytica]|uniref:GLPGLI family protein n=1 Tax=Chitinophaga caseinilytica TaxID=2267521 RepID=A0ABZ2Z942_9BACT